MSANRIQLPHPNLPRYQRPRFVIVLAIVIPTNLYLGMCHNISYPWGHKRRGIAVILILVHNLLLAIILENSRGLIKVRESENAQMVSLGPESSPDLDGMNV